MADFACVCRLSEVTHCISAIESPESSEPVAKLKHGREEQGSPEQLQKRLVELSELSMQVVLSMDELLSEAKEVCRHCCGCTCICLVFLVAS